MVLREAIWNNDAKLAEALIPIARDGEASFYYAYEVLNGPFPRGEEAIIWVALKHDDDVYLNRYMDFLKEIGKLDEFLKDHPEVKNYKSF